ncbi:Penicillin-binding protein 1A [Methylobrevis pamukkalensis]|uniref:Penicillin-binding protein 1A n=2 Tax=Methylobrevis pamukkalensis TaxID=1439726 RepID=A0A1E3H013_9HYPH|nr:Penicillin-binding protein 1A [Methylobrevis pamukkalensis]
MDEPVSIRGWRPENYGKGYRGAMTLETALEQSVNTVAARLASDLGPANVTRTARRLGVVSKLHDNPSIALGTAEVTPLEITAAYVPFANGGHGVIPYVIDRIIDEDGKVLFARSGSGPGRVIDPAHLGALNRMMAAVVSRGTGKAAALPGRAVGGKTGTSQDFRDAWFIGYTPGLTAGVWLGNDDGKPTKKATGGGLPAEIWKTFMTTATSGLPVRPLPGLAFQPAVAAAPDLAPDQAAPLPRAAMPPGMQAPFPQDGPMVLAPSPEERGLLDRLFGN